MWRWDQGRLLYFQFDVLRDIAKTLVKFDNADISKCENLFRQTLVTETGMPFLPDYYTVKRNYSRVFQCSFLAKFMGNQLVVTDICRDLANADGEIKSADDYLFNYVRIKKALDDLASDGYTITEPRVLNAANYGVPQNRMRWIVAGTRKNTNIILPEPTATVTPCGSVFLRSTENAKNHVTRKHTAESICRYMKLPYGGRDKLGRVDRLDPRLPSKTVIAGGTKGGGRSHLHPFVPRTLSVRECARLQTFPDDYIFTGANARQFTQVGNAVPPLLAYKLALAIKHSVFLLPQKEELSTE